MNHPPEPWVYDDQHAHWTYAPAQPNDVKDRNSSPRTIGYTHDIRPYLQLPHLLSLTWLAYPIISLVFIVFRLQISQDTANDAVANVKQDLLASCKAAEQAATSTASMPRYLAIATNQQITDAVNSTMNAARETMVLALTMMEAIINFVIDLYRSTFLCFVELVVRGALSILIGAVDEINSALTSTFQAIRTGIQNDISSVNNVISGFINTINKIPGVNFSAPSISVPSLSSLQNVTLPSDFSTALTNLNNSLPTVSDLKSAIQDFVDTPFELLKKDINDTFIGLSFNVTALPIPAQNTVTFCDQMDTSIVDDLGHDLVKAVRIGTAIIAVLIVLLIAANCALEWYKWRAMQVHLGRIRDDLKYDPGVTTIQINNDIYARASDHDLMSIEGTMGHPWVAKVVNRLQAMLRMRQSRKDKLIWFFHYVFHPPALACFLIGVLGLISIQLQLLAIGPIEAKYNQQATTSVNDFSNLIATSINASMYNQSAEYAGQINTRVDTVQSTINDGLFGWVNGTTTTLNDTINTFYTDVQNVANQIFGNTILDEPVQEFIRCFIGSKVEAVEEVLTFLQDNLHVDIPQVNNSVLVLSPASVDEVTQPIAQAAIGTSSGDDDNNGLVGRVVAVYVESLQKERVMFAIFTGLWLFVVLMAVCILIWESYGPRRNRHQTPPPPVPFNQAMYGGRSIFEDEKGMRDVPLDDSQPPPAPPTRSLWNMRVNPFQRRQPATNEASYVDPFGDQKGQVADEEKGMSSTTTEQEGGAPKRSLYKTALGFIHKRGQTARNDEAPREEPPKDHDPFSDSHSIETHVDPYAPKYPSYYQTDNSQAYSGLYGMNGGERSLTGPRLLDQSLTEPDYSRQNPVNRLASPRNDSNELDGEQRYAPQDSLMNGL